MTTFDLENKEQGDWFSFFESKFDSLTGETTYDLPKDGAAEFCIRSMLPFWEERQKGLKKEYKMVLNPSTRQMERVGYYPEQPDDSTAGDDAWDYVITGMRNALDKDGNELECTRENKLKLIRIPMFLRFVKRVLDIIDESGVKQKEESEKN